MRPLIMAFYGPVWLLAGWCELRVGFRVFRLDRITAFTVLDDVFKPEAGRTAADFLKWDEERKRSRLARK
ncbi:WYL domain-containing protein [Bradyrhizobium sp. RDM12]